MAVDRLPEYLITVPVTIPKNQLTALMEAVARLHKKSEEIFLRRSDKSSSSDSDSTPAVPLVRPRRARKILELSPKNSVESSMKNLGELSRETNKNTTGTGDEVARVINLRKVASAAKDPLIRQKLHTYTDEEAEALLPDQVGVSLVVKTDEEVNARRQALNDHKLLCESAVVDRKVQALREKVTRVTRPECSCDFSAGNVLSGKRAGKAITDNSSCVIHNPMGKFQQRVSDEAESASRVLKIVDKPRKEITFPLKDAPRTSTKKFANLKDIDKVFPSGQGGPDLTSKKKRKSSRYVSEAPVIEHDPLEDCYVSD